ncbi:MAG TPA: YhdP family protein [Methylophilus sp.]
MSLHTLKRWFFTLLLIGLTLFAIVAGTLQFYVFPQIHQYKDQIADKIGQAMQQPVSIADIAVRWRGIYPQITLTDVIIRDQQQRPALQLSQVSTRLSWSSLLVLSPALVSLRIDAPTLMIRRNPQGEIFLAGIPMSGTGNPAFANWLLSQRQIEVTGATVTWVDELRQAPPLLLKDLNVELLTPVWQRLLDRHSLHLDSLISTGTRQRITLDATFTGHDVAKLASWHGEVTARIPQTQLAHWSPWLDIPVQIHSGQGALTTTLAFEGQSLTRLAAQLDVQALSVSSSRQPQALQAQKLQGEFRWQRQAHQSTLQLTHIHADMRPGLQLDDVSGEISWDADSHQGKLSVKTLTLDNSPALLAWLPPDLPQRDTLQQIAIRGTAHNSKLRWQQEKQVWKDYSLETALTGIHSQAYQSLPGLSNWSGTLSVSPHEGKLALDTEQASLDSAGLLRWPLPIDRLQGEVRWANNGQKTLISTQDLKFENPHLALRLNAEYQLGAVGGDTIDLKSQIERGNAKFATFYYPRILGETTLQWLDTSILSGEVRHGEVIVKGRVADFPFVNAAQQVDPKLGLFRVTAQVEHVLLEYGDGWPKVNDIEALLKFEGKRMDIEVKQGNTVGQRITQAHADIPRLDADWPMLNVRAIVTGGIEQGIKFVNTSPVKDVTMGFTENLKGTGDSDLHLDLQIPLENLDDATFQGDLNIKNGNLAADAGMGMPEMSRINGHLKFNEKGLQAQNVQLLLFDNPAQISLNTRSDKAVIIQGSGRMTDAALRKLDNNLLTRSLQGTTDWKASLFIQKPNFRMDIRSQLVGMAANLPSPLNKSADTPANLHIRLRQENSQQDQVAIHYDDWIHANVLRTHSDQETRIRAAEISINTPVRIPSGDGINIHADFAKLNVDDWLDYLKQQDQSPSTSASAGLKLDNLELTAGVLHIIDRNLHQIKLNLQPAADKLHLSVKSQELSGEADWLQGKQNKLIAKLDYLRVPRSMDTDNATPAEIRRLSTAYPELEISAQEFQFGDKQLGNLELNAYNNGDNWVIQKMRINNPDSQLMADGVWRNSVRNPHTMLKFNLNSSNLGKTLQRFQPGELLKDGKATMSGQLSWPGSPHEFAVERLDGDFTLQLEKGQILKVQPGVGRLLGLLSLQSLPRRLTLDFRDLFSEGFAFDKIQCSASIRDGILRSDDLFMTGPAAEASIKGETNLKTETQKLRIKVAPHISDSISLAALAGGPIAGVAAFVAQKLLKDPLNKISSSEYMITGTWDNPQEVDINKNGNNPATPAQPSKNK